MKRLIFVLLILTYLGLYPVTSLATEITLGPGSTATITASETTTVSCSGSLTHASNKKTCEIVRDGETASNGSECNTYSNYYCAFVLQYGQPIYENNSSSALQLAQWCETQLGH